MRPILISPYSTGTMRGNIATVNRISRYLVEAGVDPLVMGADALSAREMAGKLEGFSPSLIHGFHAWHCGGISLLLAERFGVPLVITITGSDLFDPVMREHPSTAQALEKASSVVCFNVSEAAELSARFPFVADRVRVVRQGAEVLPECEGFDHGIADDAFVVFLPAALRPVKRIELAVAALAPLWQADRRYLLMIAGGEIDREYGGAIRRQLTAAPWVRWLGEVPRERMGALYRRADLVLNCSRFEGMPNCLLEAMALGRPVVAADISGNRSLVHHGETGWLFDGADSLQAVIAMAAADSVRRNQIGLQGRALMEREFSPCAEAERYLEIYRHALNGMMPLSTNSGAV